MGLLTSPCFSWYASCDWWRFQYLVVHLSPCGMSLLGCLLAWTLVLAVLFLFSLPFFLGCFLFMKFGRVSCWIFVWRGYNALSRYLQRSIMKPKSRGSWVSHTYIHTASQPASQPGGGSLNHSTILQEIPCSKREMWSSVFLGANFPIFCNLKNMISTHTKDFWETIGEETKKKWAPKFSWPFILLEKTKTLVLTQKSPSVTGTRTRVAWVKARYPNHLDYYGWILFVDGYLFTMLYYRIKLQEFTGELLVLILTRFW